VSAAQTQRYQRVQRADILGDRTFAMRIWLSLSRCAARGVSRLTCTTPLARNNYLSALGSTKGSMVSVNLMRTPTCVLPKISSDGGEATERRGRPPR